MDNNPFPVFMSCQSTQPVPYHNFETSTNHHTPRNYSHIQMDIHMDGHCISGMITTGGPIFFHHGWMSSRMTS